MGQALLLGEARVDGRGLPQLQSLLHTFQQAPATGRPGVYLTTGLNGLKQWEGRNQRSTPKAHSGADVWAGLLIVPANLKDHYGFLQLRSCSLNSGHFVWFYIQM